MRGIHLWSAIALLFICGILIGWFAHSYFYPQRVQNLQKADFTQEEFLTLHERFLKVLYGVLQLTDEQKVKVNQEIKVAVEEVFAFRKEIMPEVDDIANRAVERIKQHITTEQGERLENFHRTIVALREKVLAHIEQLYKSEGKNEKANN